MRLKKSTTAGKSKINCLFLNVKISGFGYSKAVPQHTMKAQEGEEV
jgi:hypothetical protein